MCKFNSFLVIPAVLCLFLTSLIFGGCGSDDLGACIIKQSGDDMVIEDISLEECQERFGEKAGATGWEWKPNS